MNADNVLLMESEDNIEDPEVMNLEEVQIRIVKEEPPEDSEQYDLDSNDYANSAGDFDINADIVTYLDVTLENDSDDEELYDSDVDPMNCGDPYEHNLAFTCEICKKGFRTYRSLQVHSSIHMQTEFMNKSTCTICHKKFDARKLTYHFRKHNVTRSYPCFYCDCSYFTQSHLDEHMRTHTGYPCNKCNVSFEKETDLKNHYKSHAEDFLYACSICDETFETTADLSKHISTHKKKRKLNSYS